MRITFAAILVALVAFVSAGYWVVPAIALRVLPEQLGSLLHRPVSLADVEIAPLALRLSLHGLRIGRAPATGTASAPATDEAAPADALLQLDRLELDLSSRSLVRRALVIEQIHLERPRVALARDAEGRLEIADVIESFARPAEPPSPPPRLVLESLSIRDGALQFVDHERGARHTIDAIGLTAGPLSLLPGERERETTLRLQARVDGATVAVSTRAHPLATTPGLEADLEITGLDLVQLGPWLPGSWHGRLDKGHLSTKLHLEASLAEQGLALDARGTVDVETLELGLRGGSRLAQVSHLHATIASFDLMRRQLALEQVRVEAPRIKVNRARDGLIDLLELGRFDVPARPTGTAPQGTRTQTPAAAAPRETPVATPAFALHLADLALTGGQLDYRDDTADSPFELGLRAIGLQLKALDWPPGPTPAALTLDLATTSGTHLTLTSNLGLGPEPSLGGSLALTDVRPADFAPWYEAALPLLPGADARADLTATLDLRLTAGATPEPGGTLRDIALRLRRVGLRVPGSQTEPLRIDDLRLGAGKVDLTARTLDIGSVIVRGSRLSATRTADGDIDLLTLLNPPSASPAAHRPQPARAANPAGSTRGASTPWHWRIGRLALEGHALHLTDRMQADKAELHLAPVSVQIDNLSDRRAQAARLRLAATLNGSGQIALAGDVSLQPLGARLDWQVRSVGVADFNPWIAPLAKLSLGAGLLAGEGSLKATIPATGRPVMTARGALRLTDFACTNTDDGEELARWGSLALTDIDFSSAPAALSVGLIRLSDFEAGLVLEPSGRLNLQAIAGTPPAPGATTATPPEATAVQPPPPAPNPPAPDSSATASGQAQTPLALAIERIVLERGDINYNDRFVKPNFHARLTGMAGTVSRLTPALAGDVDLNGSLDGAAPVSVRGKINPLAKPLYIDLQAHASDIQLPTVSTYSQRYIGYGIEKGSLSVDLAWRIENRRLEASNRLRLDQLTFGEPVESAEATKLPVRLAVALLRDRHGVIDIDLPISGSLDDPQFSVGRIVWQVIVNLITKAVTAPFSFVASLFGDSSTELGHLDFKPGSAVLDDTALGRLGSLAKALDARPGLRLDVRGEADPATDGPALLAPAATTTTAGAPAASPRPRGTTGAAAGAQATGPGAAPDEALRKLAGERATAARAWLAGPGGVHPDRIFILAPQSATTGTGKRSPRVEFTLR